MAGTLIGELDFGNGRKFTAVEYDLLFETTDCIVNAANGMLAHGGGVAAAIDRAAGEAFSDESHEYVRKHGRVPVGEAVVTSAGKLPFKGVIHAVGPVMGDGDEENKLARAVLSAFLRAHERGWRSLSFPAVSSGIYSVPAEICARAYVRAAREFFQGHPDSSLKTIRLCVFKGRIVDAVKKEMGS